MTSATLYREGDDLDALLAELDAEYPEQVRVVSITHPRDGGVLGFFARRRVAVEYTILEQEGPYRSEKLHDLTPAEGNAEFAAMLLAMAQAKSAERATGPTAEMEPIAAPRRTREPAIRPVELPELTELTAPEAPVPAEPTPAPATDPQRLAALHDMLVGIGVPRRLVPADEPDPITACRRIAHLLPTAPRLTAQSGAVLALVGPAREVAATAAALAGALQLSRNRVWTVGVDAGDVPDGAIALDDHWSAATLADEHRRAGYDTAVLAVAQDCAERVVRAVNPNAVWAVVDATRKTLDVRRALSAIGRVDALAVTGAADTASPASVLHLGVPVALLDGVPASPQRWAAVLGEALANLEV